MNKRSFVFSKPGGVVTMSWMFALVIFATRFLMEVKESTSFRYYLPMTLSIPSSSNKLRRFNRISLQIKQQKPRRKYDYLSPTSSSVLKTRKKIAPGRVADDFYYRGGSSSSVTTSSVSALKDIQSRDKKRSNLVLDTSTLANVVDELLITRPCSFENDSSTILQRIVKKFAVVELDDSLRKKSFKAFMDTFEKFWWCIPMIILIAYPVYSLLVASEFPKMPSWWAIKDVTHLQQMPFLCSGFLGSNVSYFISGFYMLGKMPIAAFGNLASSSKQLYKTRVDFSARQIARYYPTLGIMMIASGLISLVYHAFQSLGHLGVAETLCFVDHGIAFSSFCYFVKTCGLPSIRTLAIGIPSMALLLFPGDSYPLIHSLWHATSASATVSWALDGLQRRKQFISSTIQKRKESIWALDGLK
jgi:uncharacterized membrane protein (DUF485 family)